MDPQQDLKTSPILHTADEGLLDLPADIVDLRLAIARLNAQREVAVAPVQVREQLVAAHLQAALAGTPMPAPDDVLAKLDTERLATERRIVTATAIERLEDRLNAALLTMDVKPLYAALDDQLDELLTEVATVAEVIGDTAADTLIAAGDEIREAWLGMSERVNRYEWLHTARQALDALHPARHDIRGEYAELRYPPPPDELPADPRRRLLHIATHRSKLGAWIPTPAQRDRCKLDEAQRETELATARAAGLETV